MSKVITDASQPTDFSQFALLQNFGAQVKVISGQSLAGRSRWLRRSMPAAWQIFQCRPMVRKSSDWLVAA